MTKNIFFQFKFLQRFELVFCQMLQFTEGKCKLSYKNNLKCVRKSSNLLLRLAIFCTGVSSKYFTPIFNLLSRKHPLLKMNTFLCTSSQSLVIQWSQEYSLKSWSLKLLSIELLARNYTVHWWSHLKSNNGHTHMLNVKCRLRKHVSGNVWNLVTYSHSPLLEPLCFIHRRIERTWILYAWQDCGLIYL